MKSTIMKWMAAMFVFVLAFASTAAFAQTSRGIVTGTVTDPSGAVVGNAKVQLREVDKNATRETTSNAAGVYRFDAVDLGTYELSVEASGFRAIKVEKINVDANKSATVNTALQIGNAVSEVVTVEGSATNVLQISEERRGENINALSLSQ